jgi:hypothetical protein
MKQTTNTSREVLSRLSAMYLSEVFVGTRPESAIVECGRRRDQEEFGDEPGYGWRGGR